MARIDNVITSAGSASSALNRMVDASYGGLNGLTADIPSWINSTPYVKMNGICFLLESPRGFKDLADPIDMTRALKNIVEVHATSWEGIDLGLTVEQAEREAGSSRVLQYVTAVTRAPVAPVMTVWDVYGGYIGHFFTTWIEKLMPSSEAAGVVGTVLDGTISVEEILLDYDSCSMCFVEPDHTMRKAVKAVVVFNMRPLTNGEQNIVINKEAKEAQQLSIEWTGTPEVGDRVKDLGTKLLESLSLTSANPNGRVSHLMDEAKRHGWADIASVDAGFAKQLANIEQATA